jgi:hypothetical protein
VCVFYYCLPYSIHAGYITRCVFYFFFFSAFYKYKLKLLQCYYREIVKIQARLRDVQGPGVDDLGLPVSLL